MQKDMLREIDNCAVLKSYGIEIDYFKLTPHGGPERSGEGLNINGSDGRNEERMYEEEHKRVASEMGSSKLRLPGIDSGDIKNPDTNQNLLEVKS